MVIDNLDTVGRAENEAVASALEEGARSLGNDNGVAGGIADTTALASDPSVTAVVRGTLRKRGRKEAQLEEDVAEVVTRAIEAARRGPMPENLGAWKALATTIAPRYAIDAGRAEGVRRRRGGKLCEQPDLYGPLEFEAPRDPVDTKRFLAVLKELFDSGKMPEMGAEILWGVAEGVTQMEISEETGLTVDQVEWRLRKMRRVFRERLEQLGMLEEDRPASARQIGRLPTYLDERSKRGARARRLVERKRRLVDGKRRSRREMAHLEARVTHRRRGPPHRVDGVTTDVRELPHSGSRMRQSEGKGTHRVDRTRRSEASMR